MVYLVLGLLGLGAIGIIIGMLKSGSKAKEERKILRKLIRSRNKAEKEKSIEEHKQKKAVNNVVNDNNFNSTYADKLQNKPTRKGRS